MNQAALYSLSVLFHVGAANLNLDDPHASAARHVDPRVRVTGIGLTESAKTERPRRRLSSATAYATR